MTKPNMKLLTGRAVESDSIHDRREQLLKHTHSHYSDYVTVRVSGVTLHMNHCAIVSSRNSGPKHIFTTETKPFICIITSALLHLISASISVILLVFCSVYR